MADGKHFTYRPGEQGPMLNTLLQRRKLHVQLELMAQMVNNLCRHLIPPLVSDVFLVTISCNVLIARIDASHLEQLYPVMLTLLIAWSTFFTLCVLALYRLTAALRSGSLDVLRSIRLQIMTELVQSGIASTGRSKAALGYIFGKRKPLQINFGHFRVLGEGDGIAYVLSLLENTVNGVFMVKPHCQLLLLSARN